MSPHDIATPEDLARAWQHGEISEWDAVAVLLHRIDRGSAGLWLTAIPSALREAVVATALDLASASDAFVVGRGAGLDENPDAVPAIIRWTYSAEQTTFPTSPDAESRSAKPNPPPAELPAVALFG